MYLINDTRIQTLGNIDLGSYIVFAIEFQKTHTEESLSAHYG